MTEPSLALQKAIRARLVATSAVTALVPANSIFDRHARPETFPCVVVGEGQTVADTEPLARDRHDVFVDLHVWTEEPGLADAKAIAGAIRDALRDGPLSVDDHHVVDLLTASMRFLRDPSGAHGHGVVTVEALLMETT